MAWTGPAWRQCALGLANDILCAIRAAADWEDLRRVTRDISDEMGFRHFALITHQDLREPAPGSVGLLDYPEGAIRRIINEGGYRRDPVMRGALFADGAFIWSQLRTLITVDGRDRVSLELGLRDGLNEGITVPCGKLGHSLGSCTFAGMRNPGRAEMMLGPAQMFGIFAFQRARRLAGAPFAPAPPPRLEPRYRDCVLLAGQGLGDKVIAHRLGLTTRTVESYLRDARRLFGARDRTELVAAALLAGEIGLVELRSCGAP